MRYLVLYLLLFGGIARAGYGQKQAIDLLPAARDTDHPEAVIDTTILTGSMVPAGTPPSEVESHYADSMRANKQEKEREMKTPRTRITVRPAMVLKLMIAINRRL